MKTAHCGLPLLLLLAVAMAVAARSEEGAAPAFWWITDIHYDRFYDERASADTFCHAPGAPAHGPSKRAFVPQEPLQASNVSLAPWGRYSCDPPLRTVQSVVDFMAGTLPDPAFLVMGGDFSGHYTSSVDVLHQQITTVTEVLLGGFPNTTMYFVLGNDDFFPDYEFQAGDQQFEWLHAAWHGILPAHATSTFLAGGYYWDVPLPGLRVVVLNSIVYSPKHNSGSPLPDDPLGQFQFLREQLQLAWVSNERVLILSHIPLGGDTYSKAPFLVPQYMSTLRSILREFEEVIEAMLSGHTHQDDYRLVYSPQGDPAVLDIISPSVSPSNDNNPAVRLVSMGPRYRLLDWNQYVFDLFQANVLESPRWELEYSLTQEYPQQMDGANPSSFGRLTDALTNDVLVFSKWRSLFDTLYNPERAIFRCAHQTVDNADFSKCLAGTGQRQ